MEHQADVTDGLTADLQADKESDKAPASSGKQSDNRWTLRLPDHARDLAIKGAYVSKTKQGQWLSEAIQAKWEADRARSKLPAVIPSQEVTVLQPLGGQDVTPAVTAVPDTLMVLEAVMPFTADTMSEAVRQAADKVIVDHLKRLRVSPTKPKKSPTKALPVSDTHQP